MVARTLILEENHVARAFLARVVRESFADTIVVDEASDVATARSHVERAGGKRPAPGSDTFRLILVDLELPEREGIALLRELRDYPATKVATTLFNDDDHLFPALQCGADGYLLKEDRLEVLVEELQKIVRGQPPLSPALARRLLTHFRGETPEVAGETLFPAALSPPVPERRLTQRENDVLTSVSNGFTIREIASALGIRWFSVNDHIRSIYRKASGAATLDAALASRQSAG